MIISDQIKAKWLDYRIGEFKKKYESIFDGIVKNLKFTELYELG